MKRRCRVEVVVDVPVRDHPEGAGVRQLQEWHQEQHRRDEGGSGGHGDARREKERSHLDARLKRRAVPVGPLLLVSCWSGCGSVPREARELLESR